MPLNFLDSHKFTSSTIDDDDEEDNKMNSRNIIMNIKIMKKEEEEKREDIHLVHFILTLGLFSIISDLLTKKWRVDPVHMDIKWQSHILNESMLLITTLLFFPKLHDNLRTLPHDKGYFPLLLERVYFSLGS